MKRDIEKIEEEIDLTAGEKTILKVIKDCEGKLAIHVGDDILDNWAWLASEEIEEFILKWLKEHLGGEFYIKGKKLISIFN